MFKERFKDTKQVIEKPLKKEIQHNGKRIIGQTAIYKTLHKKLKIEKRTTLKSRVNSCTPEG